MVHSGLRDLGLGWFISGLGLRAQDGSFRA